MNKVCSKCKIEKTVVEFYKNKSKKDGLQTICKECTRANDEIRVKTGENKERCKTKYLKMMENDSYSEKEKTRKETWRKNNVDTHRKINQNHYQNNKEQYYNKAGKRRSLLKSLDSDFTIEQWEECVTHFQKKCAYCGMKGKLTREHFIPVTKRGTYTKDNIIPVCKSCNSSKCDRSFFEWYPKQTFFSQEREQKILEYLNYKDNTQQLSIL